MLKAGKYASYIGLFAFDMVNDDSACYAFINLHEITKGRYLSWIGNLLFV